MISICSIYKISIFEDHKINVTSGAIRAQFPPRLISPVMNGSFSPHCLSARQHPKSAITSWGHQSPVVSSSSRLSALRSLCAIPCLVIWKMPWSSWTISKTATGSSGTPFLEMNSLTVLLYLTYRRKDSQLLYNQEGTTVLSKVTLKIEMFFA